MLSKKLQRKSFFYKGDELHLSKKKDSVPLSDFTSEEGPVYVYNKETVLVRIDAYKKAFAKINTHIHYAVKANSNFEILEFMKSQGLGADVVSIGEFNRALEADFEASEIIFSGVGKTYKEIREALEKGVFQINCESLSEIKRVAKIARELNRAVQIGIRINPDIPVDTHPYIATGFRENKFGIPLAQLKDVSNIVSQSEGALKLKGISCHIGSQIMSSDPLIEALDSILRVTTEFKKHSIEYIDLGGGLGVDYHSDDEEQDIARIHEYGKKVTEKLQGNFDGKVLLEPGRSLVARAGVLLTRVEYIKHNGFKNFIIVNSGMHHMLRPSLYKAYHKIVPLKFSDKKVKTFDIVGPVCESSDVLGFDRSLPEPEEGEWLALLDAGAYGMSMASNYNHHPLPQEILI